LVAANDPEPWHIPNDDKSIINLEHVLPEKPEGNWPQFTDDQVKLCYRRIGNLCLLRASENCNLRSADFQTKKPILANSPYMLTQQIGAEAAWNDHRDHRAAEVACRSRAACVAHNLKPANAIAGHPLRNASCRPLV
jgi:hypothetical protein